jgi:two-component system chemotaxis sensor kinase CheA
MDDAIDRDALLRVFITETDENVAVMEETLVALERAPEDTALIDSIFRAAHTLKGNCASIGLDTVVELAHVTEDLLDELRSRHIKVTPDVITLLLRATDALKTLVPRALATPDAPPQIDAALLEALRRAAEGRVAAAEPAAAASADAPILRSNTVRVPTRKLDVLLNAMSEVTVARGRVRALCEREAIVSPELADGLAHLDQLTDLLQELVLQTRMVAIGPVLRQQVRTARDLATREGKLVAVDISGDEVEVDTSVIERLRDPLTHMIRNAVDHGIEPAAVRQAKGKPARGTISIRAFHRQAMIMIEVSDDGAGIDRQRLIEKARSMEIDVESISERDLLRLVLLPGVSTAREVTDVSGRGIGLDVVEKNISAIGGSIGIESEAGVGTTFTLRLPLTVAVVHGLSVRVGGESYIVPLPAVAECLDMPLDAPASKSGVFSLRGEPLPFLRLRQYFDTKEEPSAREQVVVVEYDHKRAALVVDELFGEARAVVKPMSRLFRRATWISGSALLGSGDIGLVLEVASILDDATRPRGGDEGWVKDNG